LGLFLGLCQSLDDRGSLEMEVPDFGSFSSDEDINDDRNV